MRKERERDHQEPYSGTQMIGGSLLNWSSESRHGERALEGPGH